ncbi:inositol monophosphatase family protein [Bartonella sp. HY761]|uniref:inositol monophosphatase family protein n=1 Tax=Bartonella sp. HY761 TaxID=2979330 RepID=UPI0021FC3AE7|nr:inositol monophosphatase [Bartonella sp. HY761]UXN05862.1 inositol monophosphatase [Bartonella sp. HY761]
MSQEFQAFDYNIVIEIARQAGQLAAQHFNNIGQLEVIEKGHLDLVSIADKEVENFIYGEIERHFPDDGIFGEEGGAKPSKNGRVWIIDPIDGTFNFLRGSGDWAISIGLLDGDQSIFGVANAPIRSEMIYGGVNCPPQLNNKPLKELANLDAKKAVIDIAVHPKWAPIYEMTMLEEILIHQKMAYRATGSSVISLMRAAMGLSDGYIAAGVASWDVAGLLPILTALGAENTLNWQDRRLDQEVNILVGKKGIISQLQALKTICYAPEQQITS